MPAGHQGGLYRDAKEPWAICTDARAAVWRWRPAFQNELAARMDWCVAEDSHQANHPPVAVLNGDRSREILFLVVEAGGELTLSAAGSADPDGDACAVLWYIGLKAMTLPTNGSNRQHQEFQR